jgi:hypothetical protein
MVYQCDEFPIQRLLVTIFFCFGMKEQEGVESMEDLEGTLRVSYQIICCCADRPADQKVKVTPPCFFSSWGQTVRYIVFLTYHGLGADDRCMIVCEPEPV